MQGNKQVKDNKLDLFAQKYEEFIISDDETIDCTFARFNTIITSLKALDEYFSSRNHVRKFLRALLTKWRLKVTTIEESKDLLTLSLDELIDNLKVYEVVLDKDLEIFKSKKEKYKLFALKARKVLSEEETTSLDSDDEEYAMANSRKVKEDKKEKHDRRCFMCRDPNHFISDGPKHSFIDQKAFVVGCWSDSEDESKKEEICLMELDNNEVRLKVKLEPDEWIKDNGCLRHMTGNKYLFSSYKSIDGDYLTKFDPKSTKGIFLGYSPNSKAYIILNKETLRIEESLNVKFDESPPPKSPPLEDDDVLECEIIENQEKVLEIKENEPLNKEIINIKESKDHPFETVIEPKNVKEVIQDESWTMAMQEELNHFKTNDVWSLVPPPNNQTIIGYINKEGIDFDGNLFFPLQDVESIRSCLHYACARDFKLYHMHVKKFGLGDSIAYQKSMSSETNTHSSEDGVP
ncbi:retrovirus-related pol polyprotein from transposon TNT 1-94 [Tanacetum coccineum]